MRNAGLLFLVALAAAAAAWLLSPRPAAVPTTTPDSASPSESHAPTLAAAPPSAPGAEAGAPPPAAMGSARAVVTDETVGFTVKGHVLGVTPIPAGSLVFVSGVAWQGGNGGYLGRGPVASDGSFDVACETPAASPPWQVKVHAAVPGRAEIDVSTSTALGETS